MADKNERDRLAGDANRDPLTGAPGAHPVGVGVDEDHPPGQLLLGDAARERGGEVPRPQDRDGVQGARILASTRTRPSVGVTLESTNQGGCMKWMGLYLLGYVIFVGGVIAALWKMGVLERLGATWTIIGLVIAVGVGIMIAVSSSGEKKIVEVDEKRS